MKRRRKHYIREIQNKHTEVGLFSRALARKGAKQVHLHARKWREKMRWTLKICYLKALRRHGRPVLPVTQPWPKVEEVRQK